MIYELYGIKDNLDGFKPNIVFSKNQALVIRDLKSLVNSSEGFPNYKDCVLYKLGEIDLNTGIISSDVVFISNLATMKESLNEI